MTEGAAPRESASGPTPLSGIRVIDLTTVIMGPYATHLLADLGADVVKVESPEGDPYRSYKPRRNEGMNGSVLNLHRNKRSVALDLKRPAAKRALDALIGGADVFVHNLRPAVIERLGFGAARVRALKPDLVYCGAYGFGEAGTARDRPAYDDMMQAGSGLAALYQAIGGEPAYVPSVIYDKLTGQTIAYAILAALVQRGRTGEGVTVEVPMFETAVEFNLVEHLSGSAFVPPLGPMGASRILTSQRRPYRTRDGFICILPYSDRNWADFFAFVERSECQTDPRFATLAERAINADAIYAVLGEEAATRSTAEWVAFCDAANIPCMPVQRLDELPDDPHLRSVGMFAIREHPTEGSYLAVRSPVTVDGQAMPIRHHAPRIGQHTRELLGEAGLSEREIDEAVGATDFGRPVTAPL